MVLGPAAAASCGNLLEMFIILPPTPNPSNLKLWGWAQPSLLWQALQGILMQLDLRTTALHSTASQPLSSPWLDFLRERMGTHLHVMEKQRSPIKCHLCTGAVLFVSVFAINWSYSPLVKLLSIFLDLSIGTCKMIRAGGWTRERERWHRKDLRIF